MFKLPIHISYRMESLSWPSDGIKEIRERYLPVREAPHNMESLQVSGEETFCFFET